MSGRDMTLQVVVKLRDELSRGLDGALRKINAWGTRAKAAFDKVGAGIGALSAKFGALGIGAGLGLEKGLDSFVRMDAVVRDIGITLGKSGQELERFTKDGARDLEKLALASGQASETIAGVWKEFAQAGGISEDAQKALRAPTARATTAAGADPVDMAKVGVAMFNNAGIRTQSEAELAYAHLIKAGKLGSVELKDMAQFLPEILAAQKNLGLTGMPSIDTAAANLEIARKATGTPGEAATNYKDFLSGLNSHHTKKRFADHGVDLPGVLADAAAKRINPVDAVMGKIGKIINQPKVVKEALDRAKKKGLDPNKTTEEVTKAVDAAVKSAGLGELFVNQQTKMFAIARMLFAKEYAEMMKDIGGTGTDITDTDFKSRMDSPEVKRRMAGEHVEQIGRRFGEALTGIFDKVSWIGEKAQAMIAALDQVSPKIVDFGVQIAALAGSIGVIVWGLKALGFVGGAKKVAETVVDGGTATAKGVAAVGGGAADLVSNALGSIIGNTLAGSGRGGLDVLVDAAHRAAAALDDLARRAADVMTAQPAHAAVGAGGGFQTVGGFGGEEVVQDRRSKKGGFHTVGGFGGGFSGPDYVPPPQKVEVGGSITVKVDGPGTITSTTSTNPAVPIGGGDRGPTVGRP